MKILLVNKFFFLKGGAEASFFDTSTILERNGHHAMFFSMEHEKNLRSAYEKYFVSNVDYEKKDLKSAVISAARILYSKQARKRIEELIVAEKPDIAHLHNIYHQISPSILHSLNKFNIPVVMTLHDYKLSCAQELMMAGGKVCEACINNTYYHCFLKACVKDSRLKSFLDTLEMYLHHNILHIYDLVDSFISPSLFLRGELEKMGFKGRKIIVLPHMLSIESYIPRYDSAGSTIVYFGRLSKEKGLLTLLEAVKEIKTVSLKIVGEGPIRSSLEEKIRAEKIDNASLLGYKTGDPLKNEIRDSLFAVLPSQCYENSPMSIIEAFALGKPVLGSRIGGIPELVMDGKTGLTFEPGDPKDLRLKIKHLLDNPSKIEEMGRNARAHVEQEFTAQNYYEKLMEIYEQAKESRKRRMKR